VTADRADKSNKSDLSTPDLASLDAAWEDEADAEPDEPNEEDIDEGWETVPDPKGGPPQRRRVSPKERARQKREKQRLKADAAAQKQKKKKPRTRGQADEAHEAQAAEDDENEKAPAPAATRAAPRAEQRRAPSAAKKTFDARTVAMIAVALVVGAGALYFMLTSR
jgi:hypothetical protein